MGVLDVFKRKKKEAEWPEIGAPATGAYGPAGMPGMQGMPAEPSEPLLPGMPPPTAAAPVPVSPTMETEVLRREMEALNYKVDALKATLDMINSRLANLEEAIRGKRGAIY